MFTNDETILNDINLDSVKDYKLFLEQLRPILLQESGFREVEGSPQYTEAINRRDALNNELGELSNQIQQLRNAGDEQRAIEVEEIYRARTQERDKADRDLALTPKTSLQKTPERLALEERFKKLEEQQLALSEAQFERQQKALKGEIPTSPILEKEIQDEFNKFKETQARRGNIILGDDPFSAVGKGSAATENLRAFQDNAKAAKQREIDSIINQTPLAYGGFQIAQGATGQRAYSQPGFPEIGGLSQLSLAAQQPFQFNRQIQLAYDQMANSNSQNRRNRQSQLLGGGLQLAGMLGGAFLAGPWGGAAGGQAGKMFVPRNPTEAQFHYGY